MLCRPAVDTAEHVQKSMDLLGLQSLGHINSHNADMVTHSLQPERVVGS